MDGHHEQIVQILPCSLGCPNVRYLSWTIASICPLMTFGSTVSAAAESFTRPFCIFDLTTTPMSQGHWPSLSRRFRLYRRLPDPWTATWLSCILLLSIDKLSFSFTISNLFDLTSLSDSVLYRRNHLQSSFQTTF